MKLNDDSLFLYRHAPILPECDCLDIGCGRGELLAEFAEKNPDAHFYGIDPFREHSGSGLKNLKFHRKSISDIKKIFKAHSFDIVISNPPYFKKGCGRPSKDFEGTRDRTESDEFNMASLFRAVNYLLKPAGHFCVIYPAARLFECMKEMEKCSLKPVEMIFRIPSKKRADIFLVKGRNKKGIADPAIYAECKRS